MIKIKYVYLIIVFFIINCSSRGIQYIYDIPESFNIPVWLKDGMFLDEIQEQIPEIKIIKSDTPIENMDDVYYYIKNNIRFVFRIDPILGLYEYLIDVIDQNYNLESAVLDFRNKYGEPQSNENTFYWYIYGMLSNKEIEQNEYLVTLFDNYVMDVLIVGKETTVNRIYYYYLTKRFIE